MLRILAIFVLAFGVTLSTALPSFAQGTPSGSPNMQVPPTQDQSIQDIPPAMNLLSAIPISQAESDARPSQARPNAQNSTSASPLPKVEIFSGKVEKGRDGYFLRGTDGTYRLDDGKKAGPYDARDVRIVGRLELDTNLIHIDRIEPAR